jgi:hypothetical protein
VTADRGSRQERQQAFTSTEPNPVLSEDQLRYVEAVPALQQQARRDPVYNGQDPARRLAGFDDVAG